MWYQLKTYICMSTKTGVADMRCPTGSCKSTSVASGRGSVRDCFYIEHNHNNVITSLGNREITCTFIVVRMSFT